jgi:hypothetical protein
VLNHGLDQRLADSPPAVLWMDVELVQVQVLAVPQRQRKAYGTLPLQGHP